MSNVQEWQQLANKELSRREKTVDSLIRLEINDRE